ncbi:CbrC family protein [Kingella oralis]
MHRRRTRRRRIGGRICYPRRRFAGNRQSVARELCLRTPSYSSWQEAQWADHCGDYCAFVGYAGWEDLEQQGIAEGIEWLGSPPEPEERPYIRSSGSMVGCLFRCLHCGQHILHVDLD